MNEFGIHSVECDLTLEPVPQIPFNTSNHWYTLGDLHGNALYLLHFLILSGAARFKEGAVPTRTELAYLGLEDLSPKTYYQYFKYLYFKPVSFWTRANIAAVDCVLAQLEVASLACIRLLGDILCDRGMNDYFTLKLLAHLVKNKLNLQIILSNHDIEFIGRHEQIQERRYADDKSNLISHHPGTHDQTTSLVHMMDLLDRGVITQKAVDSLFDLYSDPLDLLNTELNQLGTRYIHSHAPICDIDIYRAALCLIDPCNRSLIVGCVPEEDQEFITSCGNFITNQHLIRMIEILNDFLQKKIQDKSLSSILLLKISSRDHFFGEGYDRPDSPESCFPFRMLLWNRTDPLARKKGTSIISKCEFYNVYSHVPKFFNFAGSPLDGHLARPGVLQGSLSVHVSKPCSAPDYSYRIPMFGAGAVLFLGVAGLLVASALTGGFSSFFALGALSLMGKTIFGLPLLAVGVASLGTYFGLSRKFNPPVALGYDSEPRVSMTTWSEVGGYFLRHPFC